MLFFTKVFWWRKKTLCITQRNIFFLNFQSSWQLPDVSAASSSFWFYPYHHLSLIHHSGSFPLGVFLLLSHALSILQFRNDSYNQSIQQNNNEKKKTKITLESNVIWNEWVNKDNRIKIFKFLFFLAPLIPMDLITWHCCMLYTLNSLVGMFFPCLGFWISFSASPTHPLRFSFEMPFFFFWLKLSPNPHPQHNKWLYFMCSQSTLRTLIILVHSLPLECKFLKDRNPNLVNDDWAFTMCQGVIKVLESHQWTNMKISALQGTCVLVKGHRQ